METPKPASRVRRIEFWCVEKGRMVSVEFAQQGSLWLRKETEILSCPAFDDPNLINCHRRCLDPAYRSGLAPEWPEHGY